MVLVTRPEEESLGFFLLVISHTRYSVCVFADIGSYRILPLSTSERAPLLAVGEPRFYTARKAPLQTSGGVMRHRLEENLTAVRCQHRC